MCSEELNKMFDNLNNAIVNLAEALKNLSDVTIKFVENSVRVCFPNTDVEVKLFNNMFKLISKTELDNKQLLNCCLLFNVKKMHYTKYQTCIIYNLNW